MEETRRARLNGGRTYVAGIERIRAGSTRTGVAMAETVGPRGGAVGDYYVEGLDGIDEQIEWLELKLGDLREARRLIEAWVERGEVL